jgi:hypothetical protein
MGKSRLIVGVALQFCSETEVVFVVEIKAYRRRYMQSLISSLFPLPSLSSFIGKNIPFFVSCFRRPHGAY